MKKVSIIVPAYKSESTISETINSTNSFGFVSNASPFAIIKPLYPISSSCFKQSIRKSTYFEP